MPVVTGSGLAVDGLVAKCRPPYRHGSIDRAIPQVVGSRVTCSIQGP